jgi:hypothetical protein
MADEGPYPSIVAGAVPLSAPVNVSWAEAGVAAAKAKNAAVDRADIISKCFSSKTPLLGAAALGCRHDLMLLLTTTGNYGKLGILLAVGIIGLLMFKLGLSNAHPIIISAIINLQPFWAAVVALLIARVPIPVSPTIFFGCLVAAFLGAMAIAWSQVGEANRPDLSQLADSALHGTWLYAIPVPICSALSGTLICKWFAKYDESAAIAANFGSQL